MKPQPAPVTATATATAPAAAARPASRPAPAPSAQQPTRWEVTRDYCRSNPKKILITILVIIIGIWALLHDWSNLLPKASKAEGTNGSVPPVAPTIVPNSNTEVEALKRQVAEQSAIIEAMRKEKAQPAPTPSPEHRDAPAPSVDQPKSTARILRTEPIKGPKGSQGVRTYWRDGGFNMKIRVANVFAHQNEVSQFAAAWESKARTRLISAYKQGKETAAEAEVHEIAREVNAEAARRFSHTDPSLPRAEAGPILTFLD